MKARGIAAGVAFSLVLNVPFCIACRCEEPKPAPGASHSCCSHHKIPVKPAPSASCTCDHGTAGIQASTDSPIAPVTPVVLPLISDPIDAVTLASDIVAVDLGVRGPPREPRVPLYLELLRLIL